MNKEILNDLKRYETKNNDKYINYNVDEFMDLIDKYDLYKYTEDIYDGNRMTDYLEHYLKDSGWLTVKNMLCDIDDTSENYYIVDGYGCFRNINNGDINGITDSIEYDMKHDMEI